MEQETQTPHKRRVRYKGKYPRKFEEKYKELNPEKYKDTIEHVISKGNTPAGMQCASASQAARTASYSFLARPALV